MKEEVAWLLFGVTLVIGLTVFFVVLVTTGAETGTDKWIACIEAGKQMVRGVCL